MPLAASVAAAWRQLLQGPGMHAATPADVEHLLRALHKACEWAGGCSAEAAAGCWAELQQLAAWIQSSSAGQIIPGWTSGAQVRAPDLAQP